MEEIRRFDFWNVEKIVGKRPDREKEKLGFQVDFSSNFQLFSVEFSAILASVPVGFVVNFSLGFSEVSGLKRKKFQVPKASIPDQNIVEVVWFPQPRSK